MAKRIVMADDVTGEFSGVVGENFEQNIIAVAQPHVEEVLDEIFTGVAAQSNWTGPQSLPQTATRSSYLRRRLTGNVVLTVDTGLAGKAYSCTLELQQDATGSRTITLANVATSYGVAIPLSSAPNAVDIIRLEWNGLRWAAFLAGAQIAIPATWVV